MFKYQSGRVIVLGRVMLASLFLTSVWLDRSQDAQLAATTYTLLFVYLIYSLALAAATWRHWWLDARLAAPAHLIDMAVFTAIVFSTNGYTSPFFLFFVLPLLSAAIRWGWRETGVTAAALVVLYIAAGLVVTGPQAFELQRFLVRSGHLVILSLILIWFGIHQSSTRLFFRIDDFEALGEPQRDSLARALAMAMTIADARSGMLIMRADRDEPFEGPRQVDGEPGAVSVEQFALGGAAKSLMFDVARDRALTKNARGWSRFAAASQLLDLAEARQLGLGQGVAAEVRTGTQQGWLVLWDMADLSTDFVDLARELARVVGTFLDRHALLEAIERGVAARTRLSLARDVHDSVVQFLAGTAFRIEAIKRAAAPGTAVVRELDELKRLVVDEQSEIRGVVVALRRDRELDFGEAAAQLATLAGRLSDHWSVSCSVEAGEAHASVPIRVHLDLQQLLREAVANAVRHGRADRIVATLDCTGDDLLLDITDNGSGFPAGKGAIPQPRSLTERVERAHGSLRLVSAPGSTTVSIALPLSGGAA